MDSNPYSMSQSRRCNAFATIACGSLTADRYKGRNSREGGAMGDKDDEIPVMSPGTGLSPGDSVGLTRVGQTATEGANKALGDAAEPGQEPVTAAAKKQLSGCAKLPAVLAGLIALIFVIAII